MPTVQQLADYLRRNKDKFPLEALKFQLRKQGIADALIEEAAKLALAAPGPGGRVPGPAAAAGPAARQSFEVVDGIPLWRIRPPDPAQYRGVSRSLDLRLALLPEGGVCCQSLSLLKDPQRPFILCRALEVFSREPREYLAALAEAGKLELHFEAPEGKTVFKIRSSCDGAQAAKVLAQAKSYNANLSRPDGPAAVRRFISVFGPAFREKGFAAAWQAVEAAAAARAGGAAELLADGGGAQAQTGYRAGDLEDMPGFESAPAAGGDGGVEALERAASPELYARQPFRLLELPVDASPGEIARREQVLSLAGRVGAPAAAGPQRALPAAAVDPQTLAECLQRLQEPEERLVLEFFWFWPDAGIDPKRDPARAPLAAGDARGAAAIWEARARQAPENAALAHNLAVLHHCAALELEARRGSEAERDAHWSAALRHWRDALAREALWKLVAARIRELDDRRLAAEFAGRLRSALPRAVLTMNAALAARYLQEGRDADAARHLALARESGFAPDAVDSALAAAAERLVARVRALCAAAKNELAEEPSRAVEIARRIIEQAEPLLDQLAELLPEGHLTRVTVADEAATFANLVITLACDAQKMKSGVMSEEESLELYLAVLPLAGSEMTRKQVQNNIHATQLNIKSQQAAARFERLLGTCWYCQNAPAVEDRAIEVHMHMVVDRRYTPQGPEIRFKKRVYKVPSCAPCAAPHPRLMREFYERGMSFPAVTEALAEGWAPGPEPPG